MNHPTHNNLKAAYSFYNVATSASWVDLIGDALVLAKKVNDILWSAQHCLLKSTYLTKKEEIDFAASDLATIFKPK